MADRIYSLLERVGVEPEFAITGGMAKNSGVTGRLTKKMGLEPLKTSWDTQLAGAVEPLCSVLPSVKKAKVEGNSFITLASMKVCCLT